MELRHLRYFVAVAVAVADAGSLTVAAEQKLHTSQPSLSRQIRDLEQEIGVQLMNRGAHGIGLTSAGKAFLEHARMALTLSPETVSAWIDALEAQRRRRYAVETGPILWHAVFASVLFVLHEWMTKRRPAPGSLGLMAAFGPGFTAEQLLLRWA